MCSRMCLCRSLSPSISLWMSIFFKSFLLFKFFFSHMERFSAFLFTRNACFVILRSNFDCRKFRWRNFSKKNSTNLNVFLFLGNLFWIFRWFLFFLKYSMMWLFTQKNSHINTRLIDAGLSINLTFTVSFRLLNFFSVLLSIFKEREKRKKSNKSNVYRLFKWSESDCYTCRWLLYVNTHSHTYEKWTHDCLQDISFIYLLSLLYAPHVASNIHYANGYTCSFNRQIIQTELFPYFTKSVAVFANNLFFPNLLWM